MIMSLKLIKQFLPLGLCFSLSFNPMIPGALAQTFPSQINLLVVDGEGAINNLRQRVARDPIVKVEDENHRPVAGAVVVFTLPISGASGEFGNGSKNLTVTTDQDGLAAAHGLKTNQVPGKLQIYVTASYRGLRSRALVNQVSSGTPGAVSHGGGSAKVWVVLAVVGAAAAGGAVAVTQRKGSVASAPSAGAPAPAPIGITPGTGTIVSPGH